MTKSLPVKVDGTDSSADLGGSSKYSNEKTEVEKGSMWTAVGHGLVAPER